MLCPCCRHLLLCIFTARYNMPTLFNTVFLHCKKSQFLVRIVRINYYSHNGRRAKMISTSMFPVASLCGSA